MARCRHDIPLRNCEECRNLPDVTAMTAATFVSVAQAQQAIVDAIDQRLLSQLTIAMAALKEIAESGADFTSGDGHANAIRVARTAIARTEGK